MIQSRNLRTRQVAAMADTAGVSGAHRELLAEISDRYGWGERRSTAMGPATGMREWTQAEAEALVEVVSLRRDGLSFDQIDLLIEAGPEPLVNELARKLEESLNTLSAVSSVVAA